MNSWRNIKQSKLDVCTRVYLENRRPQGVVADGAVEDAELHAHVGGRGGLPPLHAAALASFRLLRRHCFFCGFVLRLPPSGDPKHQLLLGKGVFHGGAAEGKFRNFFFIKENFETGRREREREGEAVGGRKSKNC